MGHCNRSLRATATVLSADRHNVQLRLKNTSHLLSSFLSRTMFDFGSFSSIAVGEGPLFLVSGRSSAESSGVNLHCLPGLAALPAAGSECNVHFDLATTLGLSMLTFSDTFETARMYRRATARLRRDACTARMYLVATLLQHHVWV